MKDGAELNNKLLPFYPLLNLEYQMNTMQTPVFTQEQIATIVRSVIESKENNLYAEVIQVFEKPLLEELLLQERGNQTRVAIRMGVNRGTLRTKLRTHGILK